MSISVECQYCRTLNSITNNTCSSCQKRIPPLNRKLWIRYRINGKSRKECLGVISLREAREREIQIAAEIPSRAKEPDLRWSDVVYKFVTKLSVEQKSRNYINDTKLYLSRFNEFTANAYISKISATNIREWKTELRAKGLSEATCDRHLQSCKAAWNYAVEGLQNPFSRVKLFNPDNVTERFLTHDQRTRLLSEARQISQSLYEILAVTCLTGFRKSEVLNLKRSEVNFDSGLINIRQKRNIQHTTYLNDSCRAILSGIPDNGTDYFWVSKKTNKPYRNDWRNSWEKARKRAGIPDDFRWHDLRHDVGTAIYAATHDLQAVQRFLGHRQIKTTQRYAHTNPEYLREISQKLNAVCPVSVLKVKKK